MVPTTRSDVNALEHILSIILAEPPPSTDSTTIYPFRACFLVAAGVSNASDFISIEPNLYGSIQFSLQASGDDPRTLTIIQVKKINSLFAWYRQVDSPTPSRWFDLDSSDF